MYFNFKGSVARATIISLYKWIHYCLHQIVVFFIGLTTAKSIYLSISLAAILALGDIIFRDGNEAIRRRGAPHLCFDIPYPTESLHRWDGVKWSLLSPFLAWRNDLRCVLLCNNTIIDALPLIKICPIMQKGNWIGEWKDSILQLESGLQRGKMFSWRWDEIKI